MVQLRGKVYLAGAAMFVIVFILLYAVLGGFDVDAHNVYRPHSVFDAHRPVDHHENEVYAPTDPDNMLKLVHVLFRHGARTPADTYHTDPYVNETFSPFGWGQLTNNGKQSLFELGQWLRNTYGKFLGDTYHPDILHAQSTGVTRTQMSLATVLAGLWPPRNTPMDWSSHLNWQPIPINYQPLDDDDLLLVRVTCPGYYEELARVFQRPEIQKTLNDNQDLFNELSNITGGSITTPDDVQSLYSTLKAETEFGLKLPEWTKNYYPHRLLPLTELSFIYNVYTDELKKIKGGPFIKKMVSEWDASATGTLSPKNRKLFMYCGHDASISNVLAALNVWDQQVPNYGIMGIFELYQNKKTNEFNVQMFLRNSTVSDAYPLIIPGCGQLCPLDRFKELTKNIWTVDLKTECIADDIAFTEPPKGGP